MEPKSKEEQIAELEALIRRLKEDLAKAREVLASVQPKKPPKSDGA